MATRRYGKYNKVEIIAALDRDKYQPTPEIVEGITHIIQKCVATRARGVADPEDLEQDIMVRILTMVLPRLQTQAKNPTASFYYILTAICNHIYHHKRKYVATVQGRGMSSTIPLDFVNPTMGGSKSIGANMPARPVNQEMIDFMMDHPDILERFKNSKWGWFLDMVEDEKMWTTGKTGERRFKRYHKKLTQKTLMLIEEYFEKLLEETKCTQS